MDEIFLFGRFDVGVVFINVVVVVFVIEFVEKVA